VINTAPSGVLSPAVIQDHEHCCEGKQSSSKTDPAELLALQALAGPQPP
jgi:hypothetical protein